MPLVLSLLIIEPYSSERAKLAEETARPSSSVAFRVRRFGVEQHSQTSHGRGVRSTTRAFFFFRHRTWKLSLGTTDALLTDFIPRNATSLTSLDTHRKSTRRQVEPFSPGSCRAWLSVAVQHACMARAGADFLLRFSIPNCSVKRTPDFSLRDRSLWRF